MPNMFVPSDNSRSNTPALPERLTLSLTDLVPVDSPATAFAKNLSTSAVYSLLQSPLNGLTQIADGALNTKWLQSVQFMAAPQKAEFGSATWHAQEIGNAVGMALPFLALHSGARVLARRSGFDIHKCGTNLTARQYGNEILLAGSTGVIYGGILSPSDPKESLLRGRLKSATEQGATFATLAAAAGGLKLLGQSLENRFASRLLQNEVLIATVAGIPAGSVSADAHSLLAGKGLASWSDRAKSMYGFMFVGGVLGTANAVRERYLSEPVRVTEERVASESEAGVKFDLGDRGRLGSKEKSEKPSEPAVEKVVETREQTRAREEAEAKAKVAEFIERPNPTSLADACRSLAAELQRRINELEVHRESQKAFYEKRVVQFDEAAARLEEFANKCGSETTVADLNKVLEEVKAGGTEIGRELREALEATAPAKIVLQEFWGKYYKIFEDGSCIRTDGKSVSREDRSPQVVFVEEQVGRDIADLYEDRKLAGKSFPASAEFREGLCPVQIGELPSYSEIPRATIADAVVTFPDVNGFSGRVSIGRPLKLISDKPATPKEVATALADAFRTQSAQTSEYGKQGLERNADDVRLVQQMKDTVEAFPGKFADDSPMHIFQLPPALAEVGKGLGAYDFQYKPLIELVYERAPTSLVFTTEKGSGYRFYADGSLGRVKSNGFTRDRCEAQFFVDPAQGQRLLDAANGNQLNGFSMPAVREPAIGLAPLSIHEAGRTISDMPTFVDGVLTWPTRKYGTPSFDGHVGHIIDSLRYLSLPPAPKPSG